MDAAVRRAPAGGSALGTSHLLLVITKADVAAPDEALAQSRARLAAAGLTCAGEVAVSAVTGAGLDELRRLLDGLVPALLPPDADAPVRLWGDRAFSIRGAGTVVTGTLGAGQLRIDDELILLPANRRVSIRGLQSLNTEREQVRATARVALNLRGVDRDDAERGMTLVTPDAWTLSSEVDVLTDPEGLPATVVVHVGAAAVPAALRPLGPRAARLRLSRPLPLHYGDRLLLRDPATRTVRAADVADLYPRPLRRRGDASRTGEALSIPQRVDDEVARRRICTVDDVRTAGLSAQVSTAIAVGPWLVDTRHWRDLKQRLHDLTAAEGLSAGVPLAELRRELDLPDDRLVRALVEELPDRVCVDGRARPAHATSVELPGLEVLLERLADAPFAAPEAAELAELGLGAEALAHAVRAGLLTRLADGVYV